MENKITNEADGKEEVTSFPKFVNGKFLNPEDWGFNEKVSAVVWLSLFSIAYLFDRKLAIF